MMVIGKSGSLELTGVIQKNRLRIEQENIRLKKFLLEIYPVLAENLIVTPAKVSQKTGLTQATVNRCLKHLESIQILQEITGKKRGRVFAYSTCIDILEQGLSF